MTDLRDLLELATDRVEPTGGAAGALTTARRRRRTRRGLAASAAVAAAVVGVVAVGRLGGEPVVAPTPSPPVVEPVQPPWDPREAADLPAAPAEVAPLLPARISVPDLAPRIEDDPLDRAVLAVDDGADILLLDEDGRWHCVVVADRTPAAPALSDDGTRLAVGVRDADNDHVVVIDLATAARTPRLGFPSYGADWTIEDPVVRTATGWSVAPLAQLVDRTGLLQVAPAPRRDDGWWLVHWDPEGGAWSLVSRVEADPAQAVSLPDDLLGPS